MAHKHKYIIGVFEDEDQLLDVVHELHEKHIHIAEVYTPFPVHGLEHALHLKESRIPLVGFFGGLFGALFALWFQSYEITFSWPVNIGGKPHFPFPSFIPITFELTVLSASILMVIAYLYRNKLFPGIFKELAHERQTDDVFVVLIESKDSEFNKKVEDIFYGKGASEVNYKEMKI